MKLLFLEVETYSKWALGSPGPGFIAAFLRPYNHDTDLLLIEPNEAAREIIQKIKLLSPDILGFSLTSRQWPRASQLASEIKKTLNLPVIAGGLFPTFAPKIVLASKGFDHVCMGEGEHAVMDLLSCLEKGVDPGTVSIDNIWTANASRPRLQRPIENLDNLPFVDRKFLNENYGVVHLFTQRGCPFPCTYCAAGAMGRLFGKKHIRRRSVDNVIKELAEIKEHGELNYVIFLDDTFTLNSSWLKEFSRRYQEKIKVPFSIQARADTVSPEILFELAKAGCHHLTFGVESGSPKIRKKVLNRPMTDQQIINAFYWAKSVGIMATANYMIGLPFETPDDIEMTLELNKRLDPDDFGWAVFHPFPGTPLFDLCKRQGFLPDNWHELPANNRDSILKLPDLTRDDIRACYERFKQEHEQNIN